MIEMACKEMRQGDLAIARAGHCTGTTDGGDGCSQPRVVPASRPSMDRLYLLFGTDDESALVGFAPGDQPVVLAECRRSTLLLPRRWLQSW